MMFHPGTYERFQVTDFGFDDPNGKTIVLDNSINTFILPYIGSAAQNSLILADGAHDIAAAFASSPTPDAIVISRQSDILEDEMAAVLIKNGFEWTPPQSIGGAFYFVARKRASQSG
jgi:hypothetical protein